MAHLPLHLVLSTVVMVISQLLIKSDCHRAATEFLFILSVRNGNVVVTENGTIYSTTSPPSLYSLMRMPYIVGKDYDGDHQFTLEAVATKSKICMNKNGKLYLKPNKHNTHAPKDGQNDTSESGRRGRHGRKKKKKKAVKPSSPGIATDEEKVNECTFRIYNFHPNESYYKAAIYSAAHSTDTYGRFMAFGRNGFPRSMRKPFKNLAATARLGMLIQIHAPQSVERVIDNTKFSRSRKINLKIRQCIHNRRKAAHVFSSERFRHDKVTQVIRTCRRQNDPRFRRHWEHSRRLMKQNSMQRQAQGLST